MKDSHKPRHIRDIAHLYLSRLPKKGGKRRRRVYVTAANRECFGAYHAVNLALGFARNGFAVELLEMSGVLPCAGYFLRLPPRVYIKHKARSPEEPLSALGGISVRFAAGPEKGSENAPTPGLAVGPRQERAATVEVVHLPPATDIESLERSLSETAEAVSDGEVRALVLASDEAEARETGRRVFRRRPTIDWTTLSLEKRITSAKRSKERRRSLGYLVGWRSLLSDPVPCVVRDPESHVSRSYLALCDALVSPGSIVKELNDGKSPRRSTSLGQVR
jgi:hypothetical protein